MSEIKPVDGGPKIHATNQGFRNPSELTANPRNSRKHSAKQVSQIIASINEFGFTVPLLIDEQDEIIAGHGRCMAATQMEMAKVPVIIATGWTDAQKRAYIIADNRLTENGEWDDEILGAELAFLVEQGFNSSVTGFSNSEISRLVSAASSFEDKDTVPEAPERAITKFGDLWILGGHRLICGDSRDVSTIAQLLDDANPEMLFTDPPYGISYSSDKFLGNKSGLTNKRNSAKMIVGDDVSFDPSFLLKMFPKINEMFIWGFQYYPEKLGRGGVIVWNKKRETETENPHGDFELCWSKKERNKMCWIRWGGFNNRERGEKRLHTTQKPVALVLWFFERWGVGLNSIIDLFAGSGTTLIACEQSKKTCYAAEIDGTYCDVIINRWQNFTGDEAYLESTGQSFSDISLERK